MKRVLLPLILLTSLLSCTDNLKFNDIRVNVNTSMPAGALYYTDQSMLALSELGKILTVNQDNILSIVYDNHMSLIPAQKIDRFFTFPEQQLKFDYQLPLTKLGSIDTELKFQLTLGGLRNDETVKQIVFSTGSLSLNIDNIPVSELSGITWELPQLTDSKGNILTGKLGQAINLSGVSMNTLDNNNLDVIVKGTFPIATSIKGYLNIYSDEFTSYTGWLGRKNISIDNIEANLGTDFDEFNKYVGQAYFANPKLSFIINNPVGVPVLLTIDQIAIGSNVVNLKPGLGNSKFLIDANTSTTISLNNSTTVGGNELSIAINSKFLIDANTSTTISLNNSTTVGGNELSRAINPKATDIHIKLSAITNPNMVNDGVESKTKINHISNMRGISGEYKIELPMDGYFKDIIFEEKISSVDLKTDNIKYENFVLAFTGANTMPLDIELSGYAGTVESQNLLFDKPAIIPAATSPTQPYKIEKNNMVVVNMNKESIAKLITNNKLMFRFRASTRGADKKERVQFYSPTSIRLNVFMGVKAEIY